MSEPLRDLVVPNYPRQQVASKYVLGVLEKLGRDIAAVQHTPIPARVLAWNEYDRDTHRRPGACGALRIT